MVTGWVYDHKYMSDDFDYNDLEKKYLDDQSKAEQKPDDLKKQLDEAHKDWWMFDFEVRQYLNLQ